jgi:replicative DNA helicase
MIPKKGADAISAQYKTPPNNSEAEQALLASMLLDREVLIKGTDLLIDQCFYQKAHAVIFKAMSEIYESGSALDLVILSDHLRSKELIEEVGGSSYLVVMANAVPSSANFESYLKIVYEKYLLRTLINAGNQIARFGYDEAEEADALVEKAEKLIFGITQNRLSQDFVSLRALVRDVFDNIEKLFRRKSLVTGISTGFYDLDAMTAGFQPSDLVILAARPSMGKTALVLNLATNMAMGTGTGVGLFSLEMSKEQLVHRMMCTEARVSSHKARTGMIDGNDWSRFATAAGKLNETPIFIDDTPGLTFSELRSKARKLYAEHKVGAVIIDYLQLMQGRATKDANRQQEISEISRSLKSLARELKVPVITLSQLSRAVEQRPDKRPMLSDLRESGAIEQDADVVMFIYRDEYYNKEESKEPGVAEIIIAKQRNGPTGAVKLRFFKDDMRFANLSHASGPPH